MDIVRDCIDNIALSGLEGCTLEELWKLLANSSPSYVLDSFSKAFIWRQLLTHCTDQVHPSGLFLALYVVPAGSPPHLLPEPGEEYVHPYPYCLVIDKNKGVRGLCCNYATREDVTATLCREGLQLQQVEERYGDSLVMVASQEQRETALSGGNIDAPFSILSNFEYCILEVVGRARQAGVPRPFFSRFFKVDPRSGFHYVKVLCHTGLTTIQVRRKIIDEKMAVMSMLYLKRFSPNLKDDPTLKVYCSLLEKAPQKTLLVSAIIQASGIGRKTLQSRSAFLLRHGIIKRDPHQRGYTLACPYQEIDFDALGEKLKEEEGEESEEEEEGEEEDGEGEVGQERWPIVTEQPLDMQAYRCIESYGARGVNASDFNNLFGLPTLFMRALSKRLIKMKKVWAIISDQHNVRKLKLVAACHMQQNPEYKGLKAEQARAGPHSTVELPVFTGTDFFKEEPRAKKPKPEADMGTVVMERLETLSATTKTLNPMSNPSERKSKSGSNTPVRQSPVPDSGSDWKLSQIGMGNSSMTFYRLKRLNAIMEYVEKHGVICGLVDLSKHLRELEFQEGRGHVIDRKTIFKLMQHLIQEKRLSSEEVALTSWGEGEEEGDELREWAESVGGVSDAVEVLYYLPGTEGEEVVVAARSNAHQKRKDALLKRKIKEERQVERERKKVEKRLGKKKKRKQKRRRGWVESDEEDEEAGDMDMSSEDEKREESEDREEEIMCQPPYIKTVSKFQRLRHFHYFLWLLFYGYHDSVEEVGGAGGGDRKGSLSLQHYPWAEGVTQLPASSTHQGGEEEKEEERRWVSIGQILQHIPLGLYLILFNTHNSEKILPTRYLSYFTEPEKKLLRVHQLPLPVRECIFNSTYNNLYGTKQLVLRLLAMGLVQVKGEQPLSVTVCREVSILDTSPTPRRRSFFTHEARKGFSEILYQLKSLSDLEKYWFHLQSICVKTQLIIGKRSHLQPDGPDIYPLHYTTGIREPTQVDEFNSQGFGAGGLPPLYFSHLARNWIVHPLVMTLPPSASASPPPVAPSSEGAWRGSGYGPGVGLTDLSGTLDSDVIEREGEEEGEGEVQGEEPAVKRVCLMMPSSEVKKHQGGRGRERPQRKTAASQSSEEPHPSQAKKNKGRVKERSEVALPSPAVLIPDLEEREKGNSGDRELRVVKFKSDERASWNQEEDFFLVMSYLACLLLWHHQLPIVSFQFLTERFHQHFPTTRPKTCSALKRRTLMAYKRKTGCLSSLNVCFEECCQDLDNMGSETPPLSFDWLLNFVMAKYQSNEGIVSRDDLPQTLTELHSNYNVVRTDAVPVATAIPAEHAQIWQLVDLIVAVLSAEEGSSGDISASKYRIFKLFESFPEENLQVAYSWLKERKLVKSKKGMSSSASKIGGPMASVSYRLSKNFVSQLESSRLTSDIFCEFAEFERLYETCQGPRDGGGGGVKAGDGVEAGDGDGDGGGVEAGGGDGGSGGVKAGDGVEAGDGDGGGVEAGGGDGGGGGVKVEVAVHEQEVPGADLETSRDVMDLESDGEEGRGGGRNSDPAITLVDGDCLQLDGENCFYGSVAMAMEKAVSGRDVVMCHTHLPHPLFEQAKEDTDKPPGELTTPLLSSVLEQELSDDEEEEGGVAGGSSHGNLRLGEGGREGIMDLLEESANIINKVNYGTLLLQPALSIGKLLDFDLSHDTLQPLSEMSCDPPRHISHDQPRPPFFEASADQPTNRSVSSYLKLCKEHLGFSEEESLYAQELYQKIEETGERGVPEEEITRHHGDNMRGGRSLQEHLTLLQNFEMIYCLGMFKHLLVSFKYWSSWLMSSDPSRSDASLIAYSPWMRLESGDPHMTFLGKYEHAVLAHVFAHPGVSMESLEEKFGDLLRPCHLKQILDVLEYSGKVSSHVGRTSGPPTLFSRDLKDSECMRSVYYEPCGPT